MTRRERLKALDLERVLIVELGDGVPLETPRDHWSLRDP